MDLVHKNVQCGNRVHIPSELHVNVCIFPNDMTLLRPNLVKY